MAGLPKKYAKMGFSKGWKAYKKAKRSTTKKKPAQRKSSTTTKGAIVARKKSSKRKRRTTRRKIASAYRRSRPTIQRTMRGIPMAAIDTGLGVAGAIGSAAAIQMLPIEDQKTKAFVQLGVGLAAFAMLQPKNRMLKMTAAGTALAGALAVVKSTPEMNLPLIAGMGKCKPVPMGLNYYPNQNMGRVVRKYQHDGTAGIMGINKHYGGMAGRGGYGSRFVTQANL